MRLHIVIITLGRATVLCRSLARLSQQTRAPDGIIVVGVTPRDVAGAADACPRANVMFSPQGTCRQRNAGLDALHDTADVAIFFDDDFIPANDYLQQVEAIMRDDPAIVGLTGQLIADGAHTSEISFENAVAALAGPDTALMGPSHECTWLYGCNMAVRISAAPDLRFDEELPLYGWQEDVDFSARLAASGRMMRSNRLTGIHLGTRGGRTSGLRFGYSQVANILYLRRKQTITRRHGFGLMLRNIAANCAGSLWPAPHIDRRGRLRGNALALADRLRGIVNPRRIELL